MESRGDRARSRSRMMHGGWMAATALEQASRAQFDAIVDTLIPPEDGWPSAQELRIAEIAELYLTPDDELLTFYPHVRYSEFGELLAHVGAPLIDRDIDERVAAMAEYESSQPAEFELLRDFVYYVYYGSPTVVEEIRARTRYGADFHGATQPAGYDARIEGWADRPLTTRGAFISTDSVTRTLSSRGGSHVHRSR